MITIGFTNLGVPFFPFCQLILYEWMYGISNMEPRWLDGNGIPPSLTNSQASLINFFLKNKYVSTCFA